MRSIRWLLGLSIIILIAVLIVSVFSFLAKIDPIIVEKEKIVKVEVPVVEKSIEQIKEDWFWFRFIATGYSANDPEQGTGSKNAMGLTPTKGTVAMDQAIDFGTIIWIIKDVKFVDSQFTDLGYFEVQDRGGAIIGNRVDIFFETKVEALEFGTQEVWITFKKGE